MKSQQQSLKSEKTKNSMHKKELLIFSFAFILLIAMVNVASAIDITSFHELSLTNNLSTTIFYSVVYGTTNYDDVLNQPYESYALYSSNIGDWNKANTDNQITDCNFSIYYSSYRSQIKHQGNLSAPDRILLYSTDLTDNFPPNKYFVKLNPKDDYSVQMDCTFVSPQARVLDVPVTLSIVTPTWECQACQYYQWSQDQIKLSVVTTLSTYTSKNVGYISSLFKMFYEIAIYAFWVMLILLLILAVSLIFYLIYWLYNFLMEKARQI